MARTKEFRTVRRGRVKIGGVYYRPREVHRLYGGELEGARFLFGRYPAPWLASGWEAFVSLWGLEEAARNPALNPLEGPQCVDGAFPWDFWEATCA